MYETSPFERVVVVRRRPSFVIEPLSVAWDAVLFTVRGERECVACVPRAELDGFLHDLERGALDEPISRFLAAPPSGRVLQAASQAGTTGLFDALAEKDAAVPAERTPGRSPRFGGGGSSPVDARRDKSRRGRFPRKALVAAGAVVAVLIVAGVAVAAGGGGGGSKPVAAPTTTASTTTTTAPTTTTLGADGLLANRLVGTWTVTRTVTASTNPVQPVGGVTIVQWIITSNCTVSPCTLHVEAQGALGASQTSELAFSTDNFEGTVTGVSPCTDSAGNVLSTSTISGTMSLSPDAPNTFIGIMDLAISDGAGCATGRTTSFDLAGQKA